MKGRSARRRLTEITKSFKKDKCDLTEPDECLSALFFTREALGKNSHSVKNSAPS
jgi:hypothetical protein